MFTLHQSWNCQPFPGPLQRATPVWSQLCSPRSALRLISVHLGHCSLPCSCVWTSLLSCEILMDRTWLPSPTSFLSPAHEAQSPAYSSYSINAYQVDSKSLKSKNVLPALWFLCSTLSYERFLNKQGREWQKITHLSGKDSSSPVSITHWKVSLHARLNRWSPDSDRDLTACEAQHRTKLLQRPEWLLLC